MKEYFSDLASGKRKLSKDIDVDEVDGATPDLIDEEYEESVSGSSAASGRRSRSRRNRAKTTAAKGRGGSNKLSFEGNDVSDFKSAVSQRGHKRNRTSGNTGALNSSLEGNPKSSRSRRSGQKSGKKGGKRGRRNRKSKGAYGDEYDSYDEEEESEYDDEYGSYDDEDDGGSRA